MPTEISVAGCQVFIFCMLVSVSLWSQDTVNIKPFERYWTQPRIVPKIGAGAQEIAFVEAGIHYQQIYVHPLSLASAGPYFTIDGLIKDERPIVGPKVGYEFTAGLLGIAADATYYTDFDRGAMMFTPRAGLSILGFANLFYGYNIALTKNPFELISPNRFSLVFNINRDYFSIRTAKKKVSGQDPGSSTKPNDKTAGPGASGRNF